MALMLTHNFSEIISLVLDKSQKNILETCTSDEIRSISLMLLGYLRLIKSGFKTPNDSSEPSEGYYADLKDILNLLTVTQNRLLPKRKKEFIVDFNADLDVLASQLNAIKGAGDKSYQLSALKKCLHEVRNAVEECLSNPHAGFKDAIRSCFQISSSGVAMIRKLEQSDADVLVIISHNVEQFQRTCTHHLKRWTVWVDIEQTNQQCISYVHSASFMDL